MLMHSALVTGNVLLLSIVIVLLLAWLVSFTLLIGRLRKWHPIYYKTIGRPYSWFTTTDISLKYGGFNAGRRHAWWRYIREIYKALPPLVARDHASRRLARFYKRSMQLFLVFALALVLFVLPLDGFVLANDSQSNAVPAQTTPLPQTNSAIPPSVDGNAGTSTTQTTAITSQASNPPQTTRTVVTGKNTGTSSGVITIGTLPPVAVGLLQPGHVSRADLTAVFKSVAAVGQQKATKIDVCSQLIKQGIVDDDLAPAGTDICTDSNLSTYSTY